MPGQQHTPGPWMLVPPGGPNGPHCGLVNSEGRIIAMMIPRELDARLMVAAPELLAACEEIVLECDCDEGWVEYQPSGADAWLPTGDANFVTQECGHCAKARAALAKAKGEAND